MKTLYLVLYIIAAVCFLLAVLEVRAPRVSLLALGLLSWVLVPLIHSARDV